MSRPVLIVIATVVVLVAVFAVVLGSESDPSEPLSPTTQPASPLTQSVAAVPEGNHEAPEPDLAAQAATLQGYVNGSGVVSEAHRRVSAAIDAAGLAASERVYVHAKVQAYFDSLTSYQATVEAGGMSEKDAAFNGTEAMEALEERLDQRVPEASAAILAAL